MAAGRMALVDAHDVVIHVIIADDDYEAPEGLLAFPLADDSPVSIGWTRDGGNWVGPATPDPGPPPAATLEELVMQMQQVIDGQQEQLALQQSQLDGLIDFIMSGM